MGLEIPERIRVSANGLTVDFEDRAITFATANKEEWAKEIVHRYNEHGILRNQVLSLQDVVSGLREEKGNLESQLIEMEFGTEEPEFEGLIDQAKFEFFRDNIGKITLEQLENLVK